MGTAEDGIVAWLMLAVGADRQHGGNDGYDDDPDAHYSWDDTVPNARTVAVGHRIVLWDKAAVIGVSIIETIERDHTEKMLYRCPRCGRADIKARKRQSPRFRCFPCADTFETPSITVASVERFRTRHDASWVDLRRCLDGRVLRELCVSPGSQLSMRPLRWNAFTDALRAAGRGRDVIRLQEAVEWSRRSSEGHREARVRVRVGQAKFRDRLLAVQGPVCAMTGPAPSAALEAAHLYSYAEVGKHHDDGGLLLRSDIHRLFDRGDIAVHPHMITIDIRDELLSYPSYAALHGRPLATTLSASQVGWIQKHWNQHRSSGSAG